MSHPLLEHLHRFGLSRYKTALCDRLDPVLTRIQGKDRKARTYQEALADLPEGERAAIEADAVLLLTEWNVYRGLDIGRVKSMMRGNVFVDLRNVYERGMMEKHGLAYACVGR